MALARGFKAEAERISLELRDELGLSASNALDCLALATHIGIPVLPLGELVANGARRESIRHLMRRDAGFSALTVCVGTSRLIVYNTASPPGRRANSLAHELAHVILGHPASPALGDGGCRSWDRDLEDEADWLAAAMLVPRDGALEWLSSDADLARGARHFGVSKQLFSWRAHQTGVIRQLASRRGKASRGRRTLRSRP